MPFPKDITTEEERWVFRSFAEIYPHEAAEVNFDELLKMAQELNLEVTKEALLRMLKG